MDAEGPSRRPDWWYPSRRPVVPAAVLFMAGIVSHRALPVWPAGYLVASGVLVVGALTHRTGLPTMFASLTSKLVDAFNCDVLLVKEGFF